MSSHHKLLVRSVVFFLILGILPAVQTQPISAQDTATYNLTKYDCAPGYDPGSGDANAAFASCGTPAAGVSFTLASGDPNYSGGTQQTDGGGSTGWSGVPLGTGYSISESIPAGYGTPWVYCEVSGDPNNPGDVQASFFQAPGGTMDVGYTDPSLTTYTQANCTWFNTPPATGTAELQVEGGENQPPPAGTTTVTIRKQLCGFQYRNQYQGATLADLQSNCPGTVSNYGFTLGGDPGTLQYTDVNGMVTFSDVAVGNVVIQEEAYTGADPARVFCRAHPTGDTSVTYADADDVAIQKGGNDIYSVSVSVTEGNKVDCLWFNALVTESDRSSVLIYKYACPNTYDPASATLLDDLIANCAEAVANPSFELLSANSNLTVPGDATGTVGILNVVPGTYTLRQAQPAGYGTARVYCHSVQAFSGQAEMALYQEYQVTDGNSISISVDPGYELNCYWFDVTETATTATGGTIVITKYICHQLTVSIGEEPDFDIYSSQCTEPGIGFDFSVSTSSGDLNQQSDASGVATFANLTPETVSISESAPAGYVTAAVYCTTDPNSGAYAQYSAAEETTFSYDVEEGVTLYCSWFDWAPETETGLPITIYKINCEHFLVRGTPTRADFEAHCTEPAAGVEFTLFAGMAVADTATTDSTGVASLNAPSAGSYAIVETPVNGYVTAQVYCQTSAADDPNLPEDSPVAVDVTAGYPVVCYWYNGEDAFGGISTEPGTVVIRKYDCPPGYPTGGTGDYEELLESCAAPSENIDFSVEQGGNQVDSDTTDASGKVVLTGAAAGATSISESPITGWDPPRVFCAAVPVGLSRVLVTYDEQTVTNWGIDYDLPADMNLVCYWFDRPPAEGTEGQPIQIVVHKYLCDPEFEPGDTYEDASAACATPENAVEFQLTGGDGGTAGGPTDFNGYLEINGLAPGDITITETPRDGYQTGAVFCSIYTTASGDYEQYPVEDGMLATYVAGGYKLECYWFDVVEPDTGTVYIFKYLCTGNDAVFTTRDEYHTGCTEKQAQVTFTMQQISGSYSISDETSSEGNILWYDVPVGNVRILESPPTGYQPFAVFCGYSDVAYIPPTTWDEPQIKTEDSSIEAEVLKDKYLMCEWYDVADQDPPQVWIYKYNCPEVADWQWDYDQLASSCTTSAPGVEFGFGEQGSGPSLSITDDEGKWHYDPLTPGVWYFQESYPNGYSGAVVFCQWVNPHGTGDYQQAELDGSTLWLALDYGDVVTCYWFDFPTGHEPSAATPTSGDSGGSGGTGGTGGSGGTGGPPPLTSNVPTGPSGGQGGTTNQGGAPNAPATLIIVKRTCPAGYDLYAGDAEQNCDELTSDIDFALTSLTPEVENGTPVPAEPVEQTTGDDGKATWTNLAAGPYLVVESLPENTHAAFIWTCTSDKRQFQLEFPFTPFSYAGPDGDIGITIIGGETLECAWYDIPVAQASVTILKFDCPGSPVIIAQCDPAGAGVAFTLAPVENVAAILQLTTDESGSATGEGAAGAYTFTEEGGTPCLIDSEAIDEQGRIILTENETAEVKIYNCGS